MSTELAWISPELRECAVEVDSLTPDPRNANKHDGTGLERIAASLRVYGQRTPLVVQRRSDGLIIRKGNGTWHAAKLNGQTHIAAIVVEEDDTAATGYAIADNQTAKYSSWDEEVLHNLLDEFDLFEDDGLRLLEDDLILSLEDDDPEPAGTTSEPTAPAPKAGFHVMVECVNEKQQAELLEEFVGRGLTVRAHVI